MLQKIVSNPAKPFMLANISFQTRKVKLGIVTYTTLSEVYMDRCT